MAPPNIVTPLVLHAIKYFDAAAQACSFTRAAEQLHVTQGAVSQQIKGLEEQLGIRLFNRLPRGLALTREGERLHRTVSRLLRELETELRAIQPAGPGNVLGIRSSPSFSMMWLMPKLGAFSRLHPDIDIRLRGEMFGMSTARMHAEAIDVLIVYGPAPAGEGQVVTHLMDEYLLPVASASYFDDKAAIRCSADFAAHTLLHDDAPWEGAPMFAEWGEWLRAPAQRLAGAEGGDRGNNKGGAAGGSAGEHGNQYNLSQLAVNAALLGQGIAMGRSALIMEDLIAGRLVPVSPLAVRSVAHYSLVLAAGAGNEGASALFTEWLVDECRRFEAARDAWLAQLASDASDAADAADAP